MDYKYDIFYSYAHEGISKPFVHNYFLKYFEMYMVDILPPSHKFKSFIDKEISPGDAWPERLKNALAYSRCLIAFLTPSYFRSKWCLIELNLMLHRTNKLGLGTLDNPCGLVFPVIVSDGEHFPENITRVQKFDCCNYAIYLEGFHKVDKFISFEEELVTWSKKVAPAIMNPPPWSNEWINENWYNEATENISPILPISVKPTILE